MKNIKKQIAVAVTVAFLVYPLSSALAQTSTFDNQVVVATTVTEPTVLQAAEAAVAAYEAGPLTTLLEVATAEGLKEAAVAAVAVVDEVEAKTAFELRITNRAEAIAIATTALQAEAEAKAEAAVAAYEAAPITTLAEIATAEALKATADIEVEAVVDEDKNAAFELRIANRAEVIATEKTVLQVAAAETAVAAYEVASITTLAEVEIAEGLKATAVTTVATVVDEDKNAAFELRITNRAEVIATEKAALQVVAAETAVAAYEVAPITTLVEVTAAEGLKAAAVTAVAAVVAEDKKAAFELRVTNRAEVIETAKTALSAVVDENGDEVTYATWFSDLINKLQLALTYDPARKAELNKHQAYKKLAQAQKLIKDGNVEKAEICINQYTDKIAKAQEFLLEVEDPTSETAKTLATALVNVEANNIQVLGNLVDKLPPQAAQKLALNVVRTMDKAVDKLQKEEAKVALEVTPVVSAEVTAKTEKRITEKQVKVALAEFKNAINEKGKLHIDDQCDDQDEDLDKVKYEDKYKDKNDDQDKNVVKEYKPEQAKSEIDRNSYQVTEKRTTQVNIVPVKTQNAQTFRASDNDKSENNKDDRNKQEDSRKDRDGDKRQDHK